jgi:hypothetical protein
MACGDFFAHFLDSAENELSKSIRDIVPSRLQGLLEMALRVSSASDDKFKDDLRCALVPHTLITELFRILNVTHDHTGGSRTGGSVTPSSTSRTAHRQDTWLAHRDLLCPIAFVCEPHHPLYLELLSMH